MMAVGWFGLGVGPGSFWGGAAISQIDGLCIVFVGVGLWSSELRWRSAAWFAAVPAAIAAAAFAQTLSGYPFRLDELFGRSAVPASKTAPLSAVVVACMVTSSLVLTWCELHRGARLQLFAEAMLGALIASVGFSSLLGHATGLTAMYQWGTATSVSTFSALALLLLGCAMLLRTARKAKKTGEGPPAWLPLPVMLGCVALTTVVWMSLRDRERAYVATQTQRSAEAFAVAINAELEQQASGVERLARKLSLASTLDESVWHQDAPALWAGSLQPAGGVSLTLVGLDRRARWSYPTQLASDAASPLVAMDLVRRTALEASRRSESAEISANAPIADLGQGTAIYAPVLRNGQLVSFVAAELLYRPFFERLATRLSLLRDHAIQIHVADEPTYDSELRPAGESREIAFEKTYLVANRLIRISLTPIGQTMESDRRFLPELALSAGAGITLLLGLTVHLARRARAGQRSAELSSRKLRAENEERSRVEARLKISDERLRLALDSTQIGIFEWNVPAARVYYSPGLWAMLGYDHIGMAAEAGTWRDLIHPDDVSVYQRRVDSQLAGLASFIEPEYRVRAHTGEWRWVYTRSKTVATETSGQPSRIIGTVQDITARREAEQALRESQAEARKLSLVASKTDNPVLITSPSGAIEWINESFTRVMGYSLDETVGQLPEGFMYGPETEPATIDRIRQAMTRGHGLSTDVVNQSKSGRNYHLRLEIQPIRDEMEMLQNFIGIQTDITARVETEQTLRRAKAEADDASRAKSEFLASMSHEIRTPMNGVIGMTSLLLETPLNPEQLDFINTIRTSGEALLTVINDILDFSKIESGKLELEHMAFELAVCIEEALELFALQASAKKLEMVYLIDPAVPTWIMGDITRLRQVIVNLVNNAVKFTPSGSIAIEVRQLPATDRADGRFLLEFTVRDTGIGIPAERRDRLFKAFSQVDSSTTRKYGGTGLGLAISQRLSVLMGGSIRVESTEDVGSSFIFTAAVEAAPTIDAPVVPGLAQLRRATVLCVAAHPLSQRRLRSLLEPCGAACFFALDLAAATVLVKTLPSRPTLLIVDGDDSGTRPPFSTLQLNVPRLLILPFGETAPEVTADAQPFKCIFKPFKAASFLHSVGLLFDTPDEPVFPAPLSSTHVTVSTSDTPAPLTPPLFTEFPLDVLLAEDNTVNQKVALRFLQRLGYHADTVRNGLEALTALESHHYHLVLMDLQMPEMDGLEASREIRRRFSADRQPKIVALTANAMQGDRQRCLNAGMDDYISKPVKLHEIEASIRGLFGKRHSAPPFPPS